MPDRILLTNPFECRIVDGVAYLDATSDGGSYAFAMSLPVFIVTQRNINHAVDAVDR